MTLTLTPDTVKQDSLRDEIIEWHRAQGIDTDHTYKVCVDTETMIATVLQYKPNAKGKHYYDATIDDIAKKEPWTTKISTLPPGGFIANRDGYRVFA